MKNLAGFGPKPSAKIVSGRMQYAPTRVRAKPARFHISPPGYTQNPPDFIIPNKDTPKSRPVLYPNHRRKTFQGVCFCALHGYVQNLSGFTFPYPDTSKTHPILPSPIRIRPKPARFYTQTFGEVFGGGVCFCAPTRVHAKPVRFHISAHGYAKNAPLFTLPNKDTPKTRPVLGANPCRRTFRGVCFCALHRYVHNSSSFIFPHSDTSKTHPVLPFPIGIRPNPARF